MRSAEDTKITFDRMRGKKQKEPVKKEGEREKWHKGMRERSRFNVMWHTLPIFIPTKGSDQKKDSYPELFVYPHKKWGSSDGKLGRFVFLFLLRPNSDYHETHLSSWIVICRSVVCIHKTNTRHKRTSKTNGQSMWLLNLMLRNGSEYLIR